MQVMGCAKAKGGRGASFCAEASLGTRGTKRTAGIKRGIIAQKREEEKRRRREAEKAEKDVWKEGGREGESTKSRKTEKAEKQRRQEKKKEEKNPKKAGNQGKGGRQEGSTSRKAEKGNKMPIKPGMKSTHMFKARKLTCRED